MTLAVRLSGEQLLNEPLQQARALRAERKWKEAEQQLDTAAALYPDDKAVLMERAVNALSLMRWSDLAERCNTVRARFPAHPLGYSHGAWALRRLKDFAQAEGVIAEGLPRHPKNFELLRQWVLVACDREDWRAAEQRADVVLARLPQHAQSYILAAVPFIRQNRHIEGDVVLAEGLHRLGPVDDLLLRFAEVASLRRDWLRAVRRWATVLRLRPELVTVHRHHASALSQQGRLVEAEQSLNDGLARFPEDKTLAIEHAWVATRREDWAEAHRRWRLLHDRFPNDHRIRAAWEHAATQAGLTTTASGAIHPPPKSPLDLHEVMADPARLLWEFESLGASCEFGLVQRHFGIEPISLLRWSATNHAQLQRAFAADFEGVGEIYNTQLRIGLREEYFVSDTRFGLNMHTFVRAADVDKVRFLDTQAKRMRFLVRKFREEAAIAERILVRFTTKPTPDDQIRELHRTLRCYGPVTLMYVTAARDAKEPGTVEWLDKDLMIGFIDQFGSRPDHAWNISFDVWLRICRAAFAMRAGLAPQHHSEEPATRSFSQ